MGIRKHPHQFFITWYAGDDEGDDWMSYLNRNHRHLSGEETPFQDTSWKFFESDAELHDKILRLFYESSVIDASNISVFVINGNILLLGSVAHKNAKQTAAEIVRSLPEVWNIQNDLIINTSAVIDFG